MELLTATIAIKMLLFYSFFWTHVSSKCYPGSACTLWNIYSLQPLPKGKFCQDLYFLRSVYLRIRNCFYPSKLGILKERKCCLGDATQWLVRDLNPGLLHERTVLYQVATEALMSKWFFSYKFILFFTNSFVKMLVGIYS